MSGRKPSRIPSWLPPIAIIGLTLLAYMPALRAGFIWDDDAYVTANGALRSVDGLRRIWFEPASVSQYYPMVFSSFWLEYRLWGLAPFGYHAVNVLLHAATAVLLWRVLVRLAIPGAWVAAIVFALHPVQVESVAWITERKNVLSGLFYMMAALLYLGSSRRCAVGSGQWDTRHYVVALACFVAALLSKTVTCSLPAALLLIAWWQRGRVTWRDARPLLPFFALGGGLAMVTVRLEQGHVGAVGPDWELSLLDRCLIAGRALWFYVTTLAWPATLTFIYPRWDIDATAWWQYFFPLGAAAVVITLFAVRDRIGRGPLVAVLFFAGTLVPALGFFNIFPMRYAFVADHFQYLASIGLIVLASSAAARWCATHNVQAGRVAAGVIVLICAVLTFRQSFAYTDLETVWRDTLAKNPVAWMAHNNLGLLLLQRGDHQAALQEFNQALQIKTDDAYAHNNIGNVLAQEGNLDEAMVHFRAAVHIDPYNAEAHGNIGNVLAARGDWPGATAAFGDAIRIKPRSADAHSNLGNVLALQGNTEAAILHYRSALAADPDFAAAHHNLAVLLAQSNNVNEAIEHWRTAIALNPNAADSHASLGMVLAERGQLDEATAHLNAALRVQPDNDQARQQLDAIRARRAPPP